MSKRFPYICLCTLALLFCSAAMRAQDTGIAVSGTLYIAEGTETNIAPIEHQQKEAVIYAVPGSLHGMESTSTNATVTALKTDKAVQQLPQKPSHKKSTAKKIENAKPARQALAERPLPKGQKNTACVAAGAVAPSATPDISKNKKAKCDRIAVQAPLSFQGALPLKKSAPGAYSSYQGTKSLQHITASQALPRPPTC